jgi:hypothetical protein
MSVGPLVGDDQGDEPLVEEGTMEFTANHRYDHPAGAVFAALTDFDAVKAKYEAVGQRDVQLVRRDEGDDGAVTLVTTRVVPLDVPGFAKRFLSPSQTVTQTDEWEAAGADGSRSGRFEVAAKGTPVSVRGTLALTPTGESSCTNDTVVTIECGVPLVGGKIADFVAKDTRGAVDHEQTWLQAHLAGGGA